MIRFLRIQFFLCILALSIFSVQVIANSGPLLKNGKKWQIGYYEGGPFSDYTETLHTMVKGLVAVGWITDCPAPDPGDKSAGAYADWLNRCENPYLSFRPENFYSANWDNRIRKTNRSRLLQKLKAGNLDLVIAMGTWAGIDLANSEHTTPVMVLSTSNPIRAGIIKSINDSGHDHVTARVDPNRYLRQIRMFHRIVQFNTLGIAYEDTPDGRLYAALDEVEQIAKERGFQVMPCRVIDSTADEALADRSCLKCFRKLSTEIDAVYITALTCFDRQTTKIVDIFRSARIPTFSMTGSKFVREGIMLSISSDSGYMALGKYYAEKFGRILNGTKPGALDQLFEDPLDIAVNMETVRRTGFKMPDSILNIATEVYAK